MKLKSSLWKTIKDVPNYWYAALPFEIFCTITKSNDIFVWYISSGTLEERDIFVAGSERTRQECKLKINKVLEKELKNWVE